MAMFIAPILAVIAYFAVDTVVSEKPHAALEGTSYQLIAKSNCRYKSGICTLENGDVEVKVRLEVIDGDQAKVFLDSVLPVQHAVISFADDVADDVTDDVAYEKTSSQPVQLRLLREDGAEQTNLWSGVINTVPTSNSIMRLVVNISDTLYYAETVSVFIDYETSFSRQNFSNK